MKTALKYSLYILAIVLTLALTGVALHFSRAALHEKSIGCLEVNFEDTQHFIDTIDVRIFMDDLYGPYIGQRLEDVDLARIERILESKSAVRKCEAWITNDGVLHVSVAQRIPIARFEKGKSGFYCDAEGFIFPLSSKYTAQVPIISGCVDNAFNEEWMADMVKFIQYFNGLEKWHTRINDIVVDDNGELVLKTPDKGASFLFGYPSEMQDKFSKMERYYEQIIPQKGREYYKTVNLKYNGQIICRTKK